MPTRSVSLPSLNTFSVILTSFAFMACQTVLGGGSNEIALFFVCTYGLIISALIARDKQPAFLPRSGAFLLVLTFYVITLMIIIASTAVPSLDAPHSVWSLVASQETPSVDHSRTYLEAIKLLGLGCAFLVGNHVAGSRRQVFNLFTFTVVGILLYEVVFVFIHFYVADYRMFPGLRQLFLERFTASFDSPNSAGTFFGTCVVIAYASALLKIDRSKMRPLSFKYYEKMLFGFITPLLTGLLSLLCLVLTASRMAIGSTAVGLLIITVATSNLKVRHPQFGVAARVIVAAGVGVLIFYVAGATFIARLGTLQTDGLVRTLIFATHWSSMKTFRLQGYGAGSFESVNRSLLDNGNYGSLWIIRAMHNVYLQWLEGAGLFASATMFLCILSILIFLGYRAARPSNKIVVFCILAVSAIFVIHGFTDFALEEFSLSSWWSLWLGVGFGARRRERPNTLIEIKRPARLRSPAL